MATGTDHLALTMPHPTVTADAEMVAPIDRSNTPAANGTSNPSATTMRMALALSTERWVSQVIHVSGIHSENTNQMSP